MAIIQKHNNRYHWLQSELPFKLPTNSLYYCTDTKNVYIYNINEDPELLFDSSSQTPQSNDWKILGNTSTDPLVNFLWTTDLIPLIFRTNNIKRWAINKNGWFISSIDSTSLDWFLWNTLFDNQTGFTTVNQSHTILNFSNTGDAYWLTWTAVWWTPAAPTLPVSWANLWATNWDIYDGAGNFRTVCRIRYQAVWQPTAISMPTKMTFSTTWTWAIATTERMVIDQNWRCGLNILNPHSLHHTNWSIAENVTIVTWSIALNDTHANILVNNGATALTINMPDALTCLGRRYKISRYTLSTWAITITRTWTNNIQSLGWTVSSSTTIWLHGAAGQWLDHSFTAVQIGPIWVWVRL